MCLLEIYTINCETVGKMVRSMNEMYLNTLSLFPKCDFDTNEVSALSHVYLHPLRFVGMRLDTEFILLYMTVECL